MIHHLTEAHEQRVSENVKETELFSTRVGHLNEVVSEEVNIENQKGSERMGGDEPGNV